MRVLAKEKPLKLWSVALARLYYKYNYKEWDEVPAVVEKCPIKLMCETNYISYIIIITNNYLKFGFNVIVFCSNNEITKEY